MKPRKWTVKELEISVKNSRSVRQVLRELGLKEAGGNYSQIKKYLKQYNIDTSHFKGRAWNKGLPWIGKPVMSLTSILIENSTFQSYKLKKRLIMTGLKPSYCEECHWAQVSDDGRLPLELDHINGDSKDNRLENLRILCPNFHSLKPTHRGRNSKKLPGW